jgi:hypothetical protein
MGPFLGVSKNMFLHSIVLSFTWKEKKDLEALKGNYMTINKSHHPYIMNFNVPKFPRMLGAI